MKTIMDLLKRFATWFWQNATITACYASAGARRESYAILKFWSFSYNELKQAELESLIFNLVTSPEVFIYIH